MSDAAARLLITAGAALDSFVEAGRDDDGTLTFVHADVPCVVQSVELAPGLVVLSVTCVLAWDLPAGPGLADVVARAGAEVQFGGIGMTVRGDLSDVTLRHTFPAAGLDVAALTTFLLLVVSGSSRARSEILAGM